VLALADNKLKVIRTASILNRVRIAKKHKRKTLARTGKQRKQGDWLEWHLPKLKTTQIIIAKDRQVVAKRRLTDLWISLESKIQRLLIEKFNLPGMLNLDIISATQ